MLMFPCYLYPSSFVFVVSFFSMLYVRGSHHQLFDIIKIGEIVAYQVLLYLFLMMFFSLVYHVFVRFMISMFKHPASMCLELGFNCVLVKKCHMSSYAF